MEMANSAAALAENRGPAVAAKITGLLRAGYAMMHGAAYETHTPEELDAAFEAVRPAPNWKMPVEARVPAAALSTTVLAIGYFTGSECYVRSAPDGHFDLWAPGYYLTCGA